MLKNFILFLFVVSFALPGFSRVQDPNTSAALRLIPEQLEYTVQASKVQLLENMALSVQSETALKVYERLVSLALELPELGEGYQAFLIGFVRKMNQSEYANMLSRSVLRVLQLNMPAHEKLLFLKNADEMSRSKSITAEVVLNSITTNYGLSLSDKNQWLEMYIRDQVGLNDVVSVDCGTFLSRSYTRPF